MHTLPVAEIFGPTFQGEGPYSGSLASFVRFGGCNLSCSWCDTPYTWDGRRYDLRAEISFLTSTQIVEDILPRPGIVVLTGGEPFLYADRPAFMDLLARLQSIGRQIHVESNGTRVPSTDALELLDVIVLSPKLENAGNHRGHQSPRLAGAWAEIATNHEVHLKFVCVDRDDVARSARIAQAMHWDESRVWVMPEGRTRRQLDCRWNEIAEAAIEFGVNISSRLQVLTWEDERAR